MHISHGLVCLGWLAALLCPCVLGVDKRATHGKPTGWGEMLLSGIAIFVYLIMLWVGLVKPVRARVCTYMSNIPIGHDDHSAILLLALLSSEKDRC